MLLREMFSPIGSPKDEPEIDWLGDLKFFIDNDTKTLDRHFFPAIDRHKDHVGNPNAYKIYIRPLEMCKEEYCKKYEITDPGEKFPKEKLIELAKQLANEQEKHIKHGDYED
jgi:hypothetical protein